MSEADDLYALVPGAFTAARDEAVAEARRSGDRELAARLKALRRPTMSAFAVNQLVRAYPAEVEALLELGRKLRAAQARLDGAALRDLSAQRHRLVAGLAGRAREAAAAAGEHLGEAQLAEVEQSLRAALVDEDAAEAVAGGRLTGALEETGSLPEAGAAALVPLETKAPTKKRSAPAKAGGEPRKRPKEGASAASTRDAAREAALREAREQVDAAKAVLTGAEQEQLVAQKADQRLGSEVERAARASEEESGRVARARTALDRAEQRLAAARDAERSRRRDHEEARRRAADTAAARDRAREELDRAQARYERLKGEGGR